MPAKLAQVSVEPVSEVSETASVRHCDELPEPVREAVAAAETGGPPVTVGPYRAALVEECGCDVVKSTEYVASNASETAARPRRTTADAT